MKTVASLKPNPKNPRVITDEKLGFLEKAMREFGDLSGVVYNAKTGKLVGGHQRTKTIPPSAKIKLTKIYKAPTRTGTTALGFILVGGERFSYREVRWDRAREKAANIAANNGAGDWDVSRLSAWMRDLEETGFDLDLTMFDEDSRAGYLMPPVDPDFEPGSSDDQGKLDEKKRVICPECGYKFVPGWS